MNKIIKHINKEIRNCLIAASHSTIDKHMSVEERQNEWKRLVERANSLVKIRNEILALYK